MSGTLAVRTEDLGYRFGRFDRRWAVRHLDLAVPAGAVYGLLGPNGAGKSTVLRLLLGLLRPHEGRVEALGHDPQADPVAVKERVGYVAEALELYDWMTIEELLGFVGRYRPGWDRELAGRLRERFGLAPERRVEELSRGQRAMAGLLLALAFRPGLLLLDEPTSGLDVAARRLFYETVLAEYQAEGGTILIASHQIHEIAGLVDHLGLLRQGRLDISAPLDELQRSVRRWRLTFPESAPARLEVPGLLRAEMAGREAVLLVRGEEEAVRPALAAAGPVRLDAEALGPEELLEALAGERS
jgi:ABC-2 type transport system ATP-binding protein